MAQVRVAAGEPHPLGATWDGAGVNFALFSAHATRVELCLFDAGGRHEVGRIDLPEYTDEVWHGYLPDVGVGQLYGYRVHGPHAPEHGHRFNPHKLLLDPYAKRLSRGLTWADTHYGYRIRHRHEDLSFDRRDNAAVMPKAVVVDDTFTWGDERRPRTRWDETVILETHIRGLSKTHPALPPELRGTYAGLAHPAVIDHLLRLGVTAVELLPIHAFVDERALVDRGLRNYWGYNSLAFFAPEPRYLTRHGGLGEVKTMVRRLHDAGLQVILDVVYNHTAEGNHLGPTLSFRGIDNASYYRLVHDNRRYYDDVTGCGNTLDLAHPKVLQLVTDSLRYWVEVMHVDGFRFDLSTALGRERHGWDPGGGFFDAIRQDPVLSRVKLIAEPWDVGPAGYQLGGHGPGWAEWNDRFRDTVRAFWRGDENVLPGLAPRLLGSSDLFERQGRRAWASINFITAHDGFSLADLVAYNEKHNEANGEGNRDGHSHNLSWNCGVEGPTDDPAVNALRARQKRNLIATLLLAQGTPMLLAGDELGHSQGGNNNAYCQDNATTWIDWAGIDAEDELFRQFVARLIRLRREHPVFRRTRFLHGHTFSEHGQKDVTWLAPEGAEMSEAMWREGWRRCVGLMLCGEAGDFRTPLGLPERDATFLVLLNAAPEDLPFRLPALPAGRHWARVLDTFDPALGNRGRIWSAGDAYPLHARSLAVLIGETPFRTPGDTAAHRMPFGAETTGQGSVRFRLWAPAVPAVELLLGREADRHLAMTADGDGWHECVSAEAAAGTRYRYRLPDGRCVPDPASRLQDTDVHDASVVVEAASYVWRHPDWHGRPWHETVLYELHVGTFTPERSFDGARRRLRQLADLGITAVELMPVADFPGRRNWGYDGVLPYAVDTAYGSPDALKALVDEAHGLGLMVFLDVVCSHLGPEGSHLGAYAPEFFRKDTATPWGEAIDHRRPEVRDFLIHNALFWLEEYRLDGLRLDAAHAILDEGSPHFLDELAEAVRRRLAAERHVHLVLDHDANQARHLARDERGAAHRYDAQWNSDWHHAAHVILTGETSGYYADYAKDPVAALGRALAEGFVYQGETSAWREGKARGEPSAGLPPTAFVNFLQSHDQIGNRPMGERLTELAEADALEAMTAILLLSPQVPMLFMGEEWGTARPFRYFTDLEGELAAKLREGRRRELARLPAFADTFARERIPDPNDPATFEASTLDWAERDAPGHRRRLEAVRELLRLRARQITPRLAGCPGGEGSYRRINAHGLTVGWRLGDGSRLSLLANLGPVAGQGFEQPPGELLWVSGPGVRGNLGRHAMPAWGVVFFLEPAR